MACLTLDALEPIASRATLAPVNFCANAEIRVECAGDDERDISQSLNGDEAAFERLLKRHQNRLASLLWRFTRDKSQLEELVQDAFIEAFANLGSYRGRSSFFYWLRTIALRVGYRFWKRQARERKLKQELTREDWAMTQHEALAPVEAADLLQRLLETLPAEERLILTLHYLEELTMEEIASQMGWSRTLVKVRAHRARARLQRQLKRLEGES